MPLNYDALTATTRRHFLKPLADNIFKELPTLDYFTRKAKAAPGGTKLIQPILYAENPGGGSFRGYDPLDIAPSNEFTAAEYDWKQLYQPVVISGLEIAINRGDLAVLNLLEEKMEAAKKSLQAKFSRQIWGDGTGNEGKDIDGVQKAIADNNIYGGIDRTQHVWWKAYVVDNANQPVSLSLINKTITRLTDGPFRPDRIVTTPDIWDSLWDKLQPSNFADRPGQTVDLGPDTIRFRGIPIVFDRDCPTNTIWFFNSDCITLRPHVDYKNFKDSGWKKALNQDAAVMHIFWMGNLTVSRSKYLGKIINVTP